MSTVEISPRALHDQLAAQVALCNVAEQTPVPFAPEEALALAAAAKQVDAQLYRSRIALEQRAGLLLGAAAIFERNELYGNALACYVQLGGHVGRAPVQAKRLGIPSYAELTADYPRYKPET